MFHLFYYNLPSLPVQDKAYYPASNSVLTFLAPPSYIFRDAISIINSGTICFLRDTTPGKRNTPSLPCTPRDTAEVLSNWEAIKGEEKQRVTVTDKLRAIPPMYPALMRAQKVGKKAACFDFANADEVYKKLDEEIAEVKAAAASGDKEAIEEELGDLLLTVTSLARKLGVNSEEALFRATGKFIDRFEKVECAVIAKGKSMEELTMPELDAIWDEIKRA